MFTVLACVYANLPVYPIMRLNAEILSCVHWEYQFSERSKLKVRFVTFCEASLLFTRSNDDMRTDYVVIR